MLYTFPKPFLLRKLKFKKLKIQSDTLIKKNKKRKEKKEKIQSDIKVIASSCVI